MAHRLEADAPLIIHLEMNNMHTRSGRVVSVNISEKKAQTKHPVDQVVVDQEGIQGDAHAGKWHRQISLLSQEMIDRFRADSGCQITAGSFAENISTHGLDLQHVSVLDKLIINDVELEITQIGKTCHGDGCAIFQKVGRCIMPKHGIFGKVLRGGVIQKGDPVIWQQRSMRIALITLSDRASANEYKDQSGPRIRELLDDFFDEKSWKISYDSCILPDDASQLEDKLLVLKEQGIDVIFTTGGTGVGPRDITPDVVNRLADKTIPGIMELIRTKYGATIPNALLSRSVAAIMGKSIIYTLPGSVKAVEEYMTEILKTLEHTIYMMRGLDAH